MIALSAGNVEENGVLSVFNSLEREAGHVGKRRDGATDRERTCLALSSTSPDRQEQDRTSDNVMERDQC